MKRSEEFWSFQASDLERLDELLEVFLAETNARCALLIDRSGQLLTAAGDAERFDGMTFASLAAADFAASDQLALILGEDEFTSLYHQGDDRSMYLMDVGGRAILAALFDGDTTLGLVRLKGRDVVTDLAALFSEMAGREPVRGRDVDAGWLTEAEDEIDRLFTE